MDYLCGFRLVIHLLIMVVILYSRANGLDLLFKNVEHLKDDAFQENIHQNLYEKHIEKLKEVNGLKRHNIQEKHIRSGNIYINNPVEAKLPHPFLSVNEFKKILMERAMKEKAKIIASQDSIKVKNDMLFILRNGVLSDKTKHIIKNEKRRNKIIKRKATTKSTVKKTIKGKIISLPPFLRESHYTSAKSYKKSFKTKEEYRKPTKRVIKIKLNRSTKSKSTASVSLTSYKTKSLLKSVSINVNNTTTTKSATFDFTTSPRLASEKNITANVFNKTTNSLKTTFSGSKSSVLSTSSLSKENASESFSSPTKILSSSTVPPTSIVSPAADTPDITNTTESIKTSETLMEGKKILHDDSNLTTVSTKTILRGLDSSILITSSISVNTEIGSEEQFSHTSSPVITSATSPVFDSLFGIVNSTTSSLMKIQETQDDSNFTTNSFVSTFGVSNYSYSSNSTLSFEVSSKIDLPPSSGSPTSTIISVPDSPIIANNTEPISSNISVIDTEKPLDDSNTTTNSVDSNSSEVSLQLSSSTTDSINPPSSTTEPVSDATEIEDENETPSIKKTKTKKMKKPNMFVGFNPRLRMTESRSTMRTTKPTITTRKRLSRPLVFVGGDPK